MSNSSEGAVAETGRWSMSGGVVDEGRERARLPIARMQDVLVARIVAREEATRLGFAAQALMQIATAVSEITRNVVEHAGQAGEISLFEVGDGASVGMRIVVQDGGSGIVDVGGALAGVSLGAGIAGSRALMDEFAVVSSSGAGTRVTMTKWRRKGGISV